MIGWAHLNFCHLTFEEQPEVVGIILSRKVSIVSLNSHVLHSPPSLRVTENYCDSSDFVICVDRPL